MSPTEYDLDAELAAFQEEAERFFPEDAVGGGIRTLRDQYNALCVAFAAPVPKGVLVRDTSLTGVPVRLYQPPAPPVAKVIYLHGGGWVLGGLDSHDDICAEMCFATGADVVSVDYRLAPEHRHPAALEDALAVFDAIRAGTDARLILAGDSAGGYLAAMVAVKRPGEAQGQVLIYPAIDPDMKGASITEHANAPALTREDMEYYHGEYFRDVADNPLDADPTGFPPTVAFAAEYDPLYSDAVAMVEHIAGAGGQARLFSEAGLIHGYLRARHRVALAGASFGRITGAVSDLARGRF